MHRDVGDNTEWFASSDQWQLREAKERSSRRDLLKMAGSFAAGAGMREAIAAALHVALVILNYGQSLG